MAVCCFDAKYDKRYRCTYEIKEHIIEVEVEYDISEEIESIDGIKCWSANTEYKRRDILIVDYHNKRNILIKDA